MSAHPHAENMRLYAEDAAETDKPWERWEYMWSGRWNPLGGDPDWSYDDYRRKPKPLECWVTVDVPGGISGCFSDRRNAEVMVEMMPRRRIAHMREVTE